MTVVESGHLTHQDMYVHVHTCMYMYMMNTGDNKLSNTNTTHRDNSFFPKNELPQVAFEPTILCSLDECSVN